MRRNLRQVVTRMSPKTDCEDFAQRAGSPRLGAERRGSSLEMIVSTKATPVLSRNVFTDDGGQAFLCGRGDEPWIGDERVSQRRIAFAFVF